MEGQLKRPKILAICKPKQVDRAIDEIGDIVYPLDPQVDIRLCKNAPRLVIYTNAPLRRVYYEVSRSPPAYISRLLPILNTYTIERNIDAINQSIAEDLSNIINVVKDFTYYRIIVEDSLKNMGIHIALKGIVNEHSTNVDKSIMVLVFELLRCSEYIVLTAYPHKLDKLSTIRSRPSIVKRVVDLLELIGVN